MQLWEITGGLVLPHCATSQLNLDSPKKEKSHEKKNFDIQKGKAMYYGCQV